jgi:hypothetical protein
MTPAVEPQRTKASSKGGAATLVFLALLAPGAFYALVFLFFKAFGSHLGISSFWGSLGELAVSAGIWSLFTTPSGMIVGLVLRKRIPLVVCLFLIPAVLGPLLFLAMYASPGLKDL